MVHGGTSRLRWQMVVSSGACALNCCLTLGTASLVPMVTAPDSLEIPAVATAAVPAVESRPKREGLARITVRTQRVRSDGETTRVVSISTHVSLDALLFSLLAVRLGGEREVQRWAQGVVDEVDKLKAEGRVAPPRDVDASLSRLVQRQGLRLLWGGQSA